MQTSRMGFLKQIAAGEAADEKGELVTASDFLSFFQISIRLISRYWMFFESNI